MHASYYVSCPRPRIHSTQVPWCGLRGWISFNPQVSSGQVRSGHRRSRAIDCTYARPHPITPDRTLSRTHTVVIHRTRWWTFLYAPHIVSHAPPSVNDGLSFPLATFDSRGLDSQPRVNPLILSEEKDWPRMEMAAQGFTINAPLKKNSLTSANATHIITLCICRCRSTIVSP